MIHKDDHVQYCNTCVRAWPRLFGTLPFTIGTFTCHLTTWLTLLVPSLSLAQWGSNSSQSSVSILGNWPIRGMEILQLRQKMSLEWMKSSPSIKLIALRLWLLTSKALLSSHLWWYQWLWFYWGHVSSCNKYICLHYRSLNLRFLVLIWTLLVLSWSRGWALYRYMCWVFSQTLNMIILGDTALKQSP